MSKESILMTKLKQCNKRLEHFKSKCALKSIQECENSANTLLHMVSSIHHDSFSPKIPPNATLFVDPAASFLTIHGP